LMARLFCLLVDVRRYSIYAAAKPMILSQQLTETLRHFPVQHAYLFGSYEVVWTAIPNDMLPLRLKIERILQNEIYRVGYEFTQT